jgi:hypothetical protein
MQRIIARCGADVLVDHDGRWVFGRQPGAGMGTLLFVLGLVTAVLAVNATIWLTSAARGGFGLVLGLSMLGGAVVLGAALVLAVRARARARGRAVQPLLVLDFQRAALLDGAGNALAPLQHVAFESVMQLTSSSEALVCRWGPSSRVEVLRGSPFGGSVTPAVEALRQRGIATR